ncbi:hypothetical protein CO046_00630 [Candidatus Peregrinibacteria bacterium CG_4_9_14_0_2_um_filter_53_11]|nr:MAG: hypothetical protein CO046_00630 [Candidatus Peregrinibacteria bacterium CG_4_9_14_0_2_um_filter_53_11]
MKSKQFNERQRKVVEHDTGPILVIAGAGTGKTHVLTGRLLHLINEKQVNPEKIAAVTFTEKATEEMRDRVTSALPIGSSEPSIHTFHGLCERILRESGLELGLNPEYRLLEEADLQLFLRRHYGEFVFTHFRSRTQPQQLLMTLQRYFSRLQDEDVSPGVYRAFADKEFAAAQLSGGEAELEEAAKHQELADAYRVYLDLLIKEGVMDYAGLLYHTVRLLEERPSVLKRYQQRFQFIHVDEFQDTNTIQGKLIFMLAEAHGNLMVVGDDDQSIYNWRGASLSTINAFNTRYPDATIVVLNENYRSTQAILDCSYRVIQHNNPRRLEATHSVDKRLHSRGQGDAPVRPPEVCSFTQSEEEVAFIVKQASIAAKKGASVGILVRTNALAEPFIDVLKRTRIQFEASSPIAIFTRPGIKDCLALLRVLTNPWDEMALFRFLSFSYLAIPMEELLGQLRTARQSQQNLYSVLSPEFGGGVKLLIQELLELSREESVSRVLGAFFNQSGYLQYAEEKADAELAEEIALFSEKVAAFEENHQQKGVQDFLDYLHLLETTGTIQQSFGGAAGPGISVLTIHGSKGLEFDEVYIPGLAHNKFPSINRSETLEIPPELLSDSESAQAPHIDEERRLFYVACTRARKRLVFTYSDFYGGGRRQWKPSAFINEALATGRVSVPPKKKSRETPQQQNLLSFVTERDHRSHLIRKLPRLSYSQMNTFGRCPQRYNYQYLLKIPTDPSPSLSFGLSMHNTLRDFYQELKCRPELVHEPVPRAHLLQEMYEKNWLVFGYDSRQIQEEQKRLGLEQLTSYLSGLPQPLRLPAYIEEPFKLAVSDELILSGRFDRIDKLDDGNYEIIDYKTGSSKKYKPKTDLQLSVYALAARDFLKIPVSKITLHFLENGEMLTTTRSDAQLEKCRLEILDLADEMSRSAFEPAPGYQCSSCDYRLICPSALKLQAAASL